jgi:hypothetical protein
VRVDMFKGYTVEQRRKILQENEEVMRQQRWVTLSCSIFPC